MIEYINIRPKCEWCNRTLTDAAFVRGEARYKQGPGTCLDAEPPEFYEHTIDCEGIPLKEVRKRVERRKRKSNGGL